MFAPIKRRGPVASFPSTTSSEFWAYLWYDLRMGNVNRNGYYRKDRDLVMWGQFDALAARLQTPISSALTEAAREWVANHSADPSPVREVKPSRRSLPPETPDPFA